MSGAKNNSNGRLVGKVAIIAGAASSMPGTGIGEATAVLFAREGAQLLIVNRSEAPAQQLCEQITNDGGTCAVFTGDVTKEDDVQRMIDTVMQLYGRLDVLFYNAGIGAPGTVVNVKQDVWDRAININLRGAMLTARHCIPRMIESGGGSIINVSTLGAVLGFKRGDTGFAAYTASKAGLIGLTLSTAADFATDGVRANCLVVGMVNTPTMEKFGEQARESRRLAVPLQTEGTAWDVAWSAVYLASDEARWITGVSLPVDGGQMSLREWPG
ncbi:MAG: hypothetical protein COB20_09465 [SAR86 cluster bacterium]|uniref:Short-chain dehydrogenase n=1 Tax=SAR86 cluster bacterium TaxID=2030880 RepID=A0A2A4X3P3_9GAMM|nr:MAG: hypothetical protein COB20_09465 [SAR86 cluster bacterium]